MRNSYETSPISTVRANGLTLSPRKGQKQPHFEIEDTTISSSCVFVDYLINGKWAYICLSLLNLKKFITESGMNTWVMDSCYSGEHCQDVTKLNVDTFLNDNLNEVILAYLKEDTLC